jgi:CCR4-NOT transcription complex subunit 9
MSRNLGGNNGADPFVYAQMMNNGSQPMSNFVMQQQQQDQVQKLQQLDEEKIYSLVLDLLNPSSREQALLDLSKKREQYEDLALILWYSYGKILVQFMRS